MPLRRGPDRPADERDHGFSEYYAARGTAMRATAYLLCGDWHLAEDLVQTAFIKLYGAWNRITVHDALDAYMRRTIFRTFLDHRRRPWSTELATETHDDAAPEPTPNAQTDDRLLLLEALARVSPRQRAVLVLRFWEDLSVEATAEVLRCSPGTVKSQSARGLHTLRGLVTQADVVRDSYLEDVR